MNPGTRDRLPGPFAGPRIVACDVVAVLVATDGWSNSGQIYRSVSAGGVDLVGKTPAEACRLLEDSGASGEVRKGYGIPVAARG